MGSPAREEVEPTRDRSLSLMARYATADPQVIGILRDIRGSLNLAWPSLRGGPVPRLCPVRVVEMWRRRLRSRLEPRGGGEGGRRGSSRLAPYQSPLHGP